MDKEEARSVLSPLLREHLSWQAAMRPEIPGWLGVVCTRVAVLVGDEEIAFLAGHYSAGPTPADAQGWLIIFTPTRMLRVEVVSGTAEGASVWAVARSSLGRIDIDGGTDLYGDPWPETWPGAMCIRAAYPEESIVLPGEQLTDEQRKRFLAFLPSLLADVARAA